MPQSLVRVYVHLVFSTKHRRPLLQDREFPDRTHRYLAGVCRNLKYPPNSGIPGIPYTIILSGRVSGV